MLGYEFIQKYCKLFVAHFADSLCFIIFTTKFVPAMFVQNEAECDIKYCWIIHWSCPLSLLQELPSSLVPN